MKTGRVLLSIVDLVFEQSLVNDSLAKPTTYLFSLNVYYG